MPVYEYRCDRGHTFEVMQRMSDGPVEQCGTCGARVQRVFHPVAVHFKGSGFYTTDYGRRKAASDGDGSKPDAGEGKSKDEAGGDAKPAVKKDKPASSSSAS